MALHRYLVDEVCLDHRDGHISRREAIRLLTLMGVGTVVATSMLDESSAEAATTKRKATTTKPTTTKAKRPSPTRQAPTTLVSAGTGPAVATSAITFAGPVGQLRGSFAAATQPLGSVLIIHENRGLTEHFKALPGRFARDGYSALAIDLASRVGGTDAVADQMPAPLSQASTEDLVADAQAGLDELTRRAPNQRLATIGFCFGGGMVWNLLQANEPRLAAAVPFYGTGPAEPDFGRSKAAVLAIYAELDARVNANRPQMEAALKAAKLVHEVRTFPGVNHAFFNDTGARYDAQQAGPAYNVVLTWFARYLGD
jgi:carboxymethylenebutenolidase